MTILKKKVAIDRKSNVSFKVGIRGKKSQLLNN